LILAITTIDTRCGIDLSPQQFHQLMSVRFRWIADVGEGLFNTESGRSDTEIDKKLTIQSGHCVEYILLTKNEDICASAFIFSHITLKYLITY